MPPEKNQNQNRSPIKSLRTFQGDVQEAIAKNNFSSATILVSEQKRKEERPELKNLEKKVETRNNTMIIFSLAFILLGILTIASFYYIQSKNEVVIEQKQETLINFKDKREIVIENSNRGQIINIILENKKSWNSTVNDVLYLDFTLNGKSINSESFISFITEKTPPSLLRSFNPKYMAGIYSFDTNEPFIVIEIEDFSLAYPGMLKWEEDIASDLGKIFEIENVQGKLFKDEAVKNRDLRVLYDNDNIEQIVYSFIDRKTLIITKNEKILSAIATKLILNKQIK